MVANTDSRLARWQLLLRQKEVPRYEVLHSNGQE
jgi:hypothetical protein